MVNVLKRLFGPEDAVQSQVPQRPALTGASWSFVHYSPVIRGAIHFDDSRGHWAYVLFTRRRECDDFSVAEHDVGFSSWESALKALRHAADGRR